MAKNSPLSSWMPKIKPKQEPKFHQDLKLTGVAKSTNLPLRIERKGPLVRYFVIFTPPFPLLGQYQSLFFIFLT